MDLGITAITEYDTTAGCIKIRGPEKLSEFIVARSIGPVSQCYSPLIPSLTDRLGMACSIAGRILRINPKIDWSMYKEFILTSEDYVRSNFQDYIVSEDEMMSFEEWLAESTYTEDYKQELRLLYDQYKNIPLTHIKFIKTLVFFIKLEEYLKLSVPRGIFACPDIVKAKMGYVIASVERKLYKNDQCVKIMSPEKRVQFLMKIMNGRKYLITVDFKRMESIYNKKLLKLVDGFTMKYCLPSTYHEAIDDYVAYETGSIKVRDSSGMVKATIQCKRCSGALTTSSGHFLTNIFITNYISVKTQVGYRMVAEGDDNIVAWDGPVCFEYFYNKLGAEIKIESYYSIGCASFVHLEFNEETLTRFRDAAEILLKLTWTLSDYRNTREKKVLKALLKAKTMSCLYEFPNCPIISVVAYHFYKQVIHYRALFQWDSYKMLKYKDIEQMTFLEPHITDNDRLVYEELYDITVEAQFLLEHAILAVSVDDAYLPAVFDELLFQKHKYCDQWQWYTHYYRRPYERIGTMQETIMSHKGHSVTI